ncbi:hypothetical protein BsWGS_04181 [Bradybaena similaris]
MHLRAAGIYRVLSVYRTVLLLCVIHLLVNSFVRSYPTETGGSRDSVSAKTVKRFSAGSGRELWTRETRTAETLAFKRSLNASMGTAHKTADTATKTGDPSHIRKSNRRKTRRRGPKRVHRQTSIHLISGTHLRRFHKALADLINVMVPFLQTLKQRFLLHDNRAIYNVVRIPEVLPLNDPAFELRDVWTLMRKFALLENILREVLRYSWRRVQFDHRDWLAAESRDVEFALNVAYTRALALPFDDDVVDLHFGIGAINSGHRLSFPSGLLTALADMIQLLRTAPQYC